ncbi:GNAT family N-acetyltransferase [Brevibacterium sp.]|uniref:GNAT family N-acetyltransferase n=1 Tax=Brevibacterium sp. TaxID=1701 RepID=UPI002811DB53|nr:GNAT family N-acetyltransferase [Brevibacterium sp.]
MTETIRAATTADLAPVAGVLARAFAEYPWTRWALPEDDYARRLVGVQRLYLGHALKHGIVLVDDQIHAVAAFLPPGCPPPEEATQRQVAELHGSRMAALAQAQTPAAPAGAWTLETLGVDPDCQGQGLGSAVVAAGLALIDGRGEPVALETSDERNVRLYQRLGFDTHATTEIQSGLVVWSMSRSPGSVTVG